MKENVQQTCRFMRHLSLSFYVPTVCIGNDKWLNRVSFIQCLHQHFCLSFQQNRHLFRILTLSHILNAPIQLCLIFRNEHIKPFLHIVTLFVYYYLLCFSDFIAVIYYFLYNFIVCF